MKVERFMSLVLSSVRLEILLAGMLASKRKVLSFPSCSGGRKKEWFPQAERTCLNAAFGWENRPKIFKKISHSGTGSYWMLEYF